MKHLFKSLIALLLVVATLAVFAACGDTPGGETPGESVDYVSQLKLDMSSSTKKQEVTVKTYVDGDTTHFNVPDSVIHGGVLKARYLAINTPESTGKIEEWGKKASNFTKQTLMNASSILVESEDSNWNADSTGGRYLVWVWYKNSESEDWRNLNLEILQNGLCIASSTANNRYGETCMAALNQAKAQKLNVFSGQRDPDFYYGDAIEMSLIELRCNIEEYNGQKVAFEGVITANASETVYVEEYDPDTNMYIGMTVYYGYNLAPAGLEILQVGHRVRIVGTVQYYETGGTWQVSGLQYRAMKPDDPSNIQKISEGHDAAYVETDINTFLNGKVEVELEEETKTFDYGNLALSTSISMKDLKVKSVHMTDDEDSSSYGALTITCTNGSNTIKVRTAVLYDENGERVTADYFTGKTIDVRGIVDYFGGAYQIKVLGLSNITIH